MIEKGTAGKGTLQIINRERIVPKIILGKCIKHLQGIKVFIGSFF
jgi:hypothetical protein